MIGRTKPRLRLCVTLLITNLLFIWGNSALPASASATLSGWVKELIGLILPSEGPDIQGHGIIRKLAHFLEFCTLGMLLSWLFGMCMAKIPSAAGMAVMSAFLVACADESIQYFSPGRSPGIRDVGIDTAGAILGIIFLWSGYIIYQKHKKFKITTGGKQQ